MRLGSLGPTELILIVLVIVLIFGASKLGDIGGALGKSVKEFKKSTKEDDLATTTVVETTTTPVAASQTPVTVEKTTTSTITDFRPTESKPS